MPPRRGCCRWARTERRVAERALAVPRVSALPYLLSAPGLILYAVCLVAPLAMTALLSFYTFTMATGISTSMSLANYAEILADDYFHTIFARTFGMALAVTLISVLIGTPEAWILHRMNRRWRAAFLLVILGPLLIPVVVRTLGWALFLGRNGIVNRTLTELGLVTTPIEFMYTFTGMVVALTHVLCPFLVLAVWANLQRMDPATEAAALSLGASRTRAVLRVVLPQIMPGVLSGCLIVFTLAASAFATPAIIGGRRLKVAATATYDEFLNSQNWPLGAAIAVLLLVSILTIVLVWNRAVERRFAASFQG
ncbi:MAG: ABC transporter permease [Alphaproteobacteria bacterium]|nr:ABC transporter permease [Alphaproteobacteria bacterium]